MRSKSTALTGLGVSVVLVLASVTLVSYQDPASTGGWLKEGRKCIQVNGRDSVVRATVHSYSCCSAHADGSDLNQWLSQINRQA